MLELCAKNALGSESWVFGVWVKQSGAWGFASQGEIPQWDDWRWGLEMEGAGEREEGCRRRRCRRWRLPRRWSDGWK